MRLWFALIVQCYVSILNNHEAIEFMVYTKLMGYEASLWVFYFVGGSWDEL